MHLQPSRPLPALPRRLSRLIRIALLMLGIPSLASIHGVAPDPVAAAQSTAPTVRRSDLMVTITDDDGEGSLRQAIHDANARDGPDTIRFDSTDGPFATPQTIALESELPVLVDELTIDGYIEDRLWKPSGVIVSGASAWRVFDVGAGAKVTISSLTIADGRAGRGAGIASRGELVVRGVTFNRNVADDVGGGLASLGGTLTVLNTTFVGNRAGIAGGGLADLDGAVTVTNSTFSGNGAEQGGGLFSTGTLLLRNTILANSTSGADCVAAGAVEAPSTHNLIEANEGCGEPITTADPRLQKLGAYNGPTPTLPLGGGSPGINLGHNASAVDEHGEPLRWDQRGNGDPRFVAGITDIGAFEVQAFPNLVVDTTEDIDLRGCRGGRPDCSLRGAITLANATPKADVITFDPRVFTAVRTIVVTRPLPDVVVDLILDASGTDGVRVRGDPVGLRAVSDAKLTLEGITLSNE